MVKQKSQAFWNAANQDDEGNPIERAFEEALKDFFKYGTEFGAAGETLASIQEDMDDALARLEALDKSSETYATESQEILAELIELGRARRSRKEEAKAAKAEAAAA